MKLEAIGNWAEGDIIFVPMWHSKCLFLAHCYQDYGW